MQNDAPGKLLLSARDAAKALSVCEKTLWSMTKPRGPIPCVRIGTRCLYSVDALRQFVVNAEQLAQAGEALGDGQN